MEQKDIRRQLEKLPEEKKALLLSRLEAETGVTASALEKAAENPATAEKLNALAGKIDPSALAALTEDPAKITALLRSPQVKNALRQLNSGK